METPLVTLSPPRFALSSGWLKPLSEVPRVAPWLEPCRGLLFGGQTSEQAFTRGRGFYIGLGVWVIPPVTLVVHSVRSCRFSANTHLYKGDLPAPGNNHIVDVDGVVPRPQDPLVNPQEPFTHQDVDLSAWLSRGC